MEEDNLHALASYPSFYAFPLTKNFGFELEQKAFYFPRDSGAEGADHDSRKSPACGLSSWRTSSFSSCSGSSASTSFISSSSLLTAAEFFPQLAAVIGNTPFYLYDEARLRANCRRLLRAFKTLRTPVPFSLAAVADSASVGGSRASAADAVSAAVAAIASSVPPVPAGIVQSHTATKENLLPSSSSASFSCPFSSVSSTVPLFKHFTNYFAVKATPTPAILRIIYDEGLGVDCSTLSELLLAEAVGFWGERIFFTSSCTSPEAYRKAYDLRAIITVDNPADIHMLRLYFGGDMPDILCFRYTPSGVDQAAGAALLTSPPSAITGLATPAGPAAVTRASTGSASSQTGTIAATPPSIWHLKKDETLRSNPGILGEWHESKFGMTGTQVLTAVQQALRMGVHRIGLHSMILSNSLDVEEIVAAAACSFLLAKHIRDLLGIDVELINLGGGIGIPYKPGQATLDVDALAQKLQHCLLRVFCSSSNTSSTNDVVGSTLRSACTSIGNPTIPGSLRESNNSAVGPSRRGSSSKLKSTSCYSRGVADGNLKRQTVETAAIKLQSLPRIVMENGRFLTADAAVLVTRVTHLKQTYKNYIGVDACMANLMRPGMYGAYHHITVVPDTERRGTYTQFVYPSFESELPPEGAGPEPPQRPSFADLLLAATQAPEQTHGVPAHPPVRQTADPPQAQPMWPRPLPEQKEGTDVLLVYDVVGGLCENNDKFAVDRLLPRVEVGDLLLIHDVGAHGHTMGFNYNGRLRMNTYVTVHNGNVPAITTEVTSFSSPFSEILVLERTECKGSRIHKYWTGVVAAHRTNIQRSMECLRRLDGSIELIRRAEDFEDLFATVCCPGMPASAELLRLARYYDGLGMYDRQPPPSGNAPGSYGSRRTSLFTTVVARVKAKLFGDSDTEYEDEETCVCRAAAIDCFCTTLFLSTGLVAAALTARLLLRYMKPKM